MSDRLVSSGLVKEHKVTIRLSPGEHDELKQLAVDGGCSLSELIRLRLFGAVRGRRSSVEDRLKRVEERLTVVERWQTEADIQAALK